MESRQEKVYLAVGGNLGDRTKNFMAAAESLAQAPRVELLRASPVYETCAVGPGAQENYWNAVLELGVSPGPDPSELLELCLRIEQSMGRKRTVRWGPRTLDLDILLYGDREIRREFLTIPHPRLREREFVLQPLSDLIPERVLWGRRIMDWMAACDEVCLGRVSFDWGGYAERVVLLENE